ncbi:MAG: thiamine-phosphate kinase [Bradyrhizobiaceae bacterium]|nr:MAG: thiamine-phosphate kinase [Bradyrhizobiaceae bacterium]
MSAGGNSTSGEDDLIARYFRPLATHDGAFGLIDDAAVLSPSGEEIVVTVDAIVEGVHFLPGDPPDTVAHKALRVNLSDLAAKGATPAGFLLTLALREKTDAWLAPFARALGEDAVRFKCPLLGGDTVSTPGPLTISITAFGLVEPGKMVKRTGARAGDRVAVTGTIGDAVLGLDILQNGKAAAALAGDSLDRDYLVSRYHVPQPRNALAQTVRDYASAAMDISDGLAGDLTKLCAASGVSAQVEAIAVPLSAAARRVLESGAAGLETLLAGGDDYELLCTVPEANWAVFCESAQRAGIPVNAIGTIVEGAEPPVFTDREGRKLVLKRLSYSHF